MEGKLRYSGQAKAIIDGLKEESFDIEKFEKWFKDQFVVGGGHVVEYLSYLKKLE